MNEYERSAEDRANAADEKAQAHQEMLGFQGAAEAYLKAALTRPLTPEEVSIIGFVGCIPVSPIPVQQPEQVK